MQSNNKYLITYKTRSENPKISNMKNWYHGNSKARDLTVVCPCLITCSIQNAGFVTLDSCISCIIVDIVLTFSAKDESVNTCSIAEVNSKVVNLAISSTTAIPLSAASTELVYWSTPIGSRTNGMLWYTDSIKLFSPPCAINSLTFGWPRTSFCSNQLTICTFFGTHSGISPLYFHKIFCRTFPKASSIFSKVSLGKSSNHDPNDTTMTP